MNSNNNKVAIVTGGAKNIGRATCIELAKLNFNILIHANTDNKGAQETKSLLIIIIYPFLNCLAPIIF